MPINGVSKATLWLYLAFNLLIAVTLMFNPEQIDAQYRGGPMTPTRQFQWFSVATFHLFVVAVTWISLTLRDAAERRRLHLVNAGFFLWDAATQWAYWGDHVGMEASQLHVNAGVSAAIGLLLLGLVWWRDRP